MSILSPNPVHNLLSINAVSCSHVSISDAIGRIDYQALIPEQAVAKLLVRCTEFPSGVYRVMQERGGVVSSEQMVVVH